MKRVLAEIALGGRGNLGKWADLIVDSAHVILWRNSHINHAIAGAAGTLSELCALIRGGFPATHSCAGAAKRSIISDIEPLIRAITSPPVPAQVEWGVEPVVEGIGAER